MHVEKFLHRALDLVLAGPMIDFEEVLLLQFPQLGAFLGDQRTADDLMRFHKNSLY